MVPGKPRGYDDDMKLVSICGLVLLATNAERCGPTDEEIGRAVLLIVPAVLVVHFGLMHLLLRLWRVVAPALSLRNGPTLWAGGAFVLLSVLALVLPYQDPASREGGVMDVAFPALVLVGTSVLAVQLLAFRILLWVAPGKAFTWAFLAGPVFLWAAPLLAFLPASYPWANWMIPAWAWAGVWGVVPGALLLLLLVEVGIRRSRRPIG
jgi:hypothetical protein